MAITRTGPPTEEDVRGTLRGVVDPELGANIVDLGMVNAIDVDPDGFVLVTVALTISGCPLRVQIRDDVESKVRGLPGVTGVTVKFGEMDQAQRSAVMQRARKHAADHAPETEIPLTTRIVAIASGKGGVGKSSVTVNLASALAARGFTVGVLDADIWGFSVPRMLGLGGRLEGNDQGLISPLEVPVGAGRIKVVSMGFLVDDEDMAIMWRGLMLAKALEEFLVKVAWGPMDYLLVDMPPGTGDVQMALGRLLPRTEMVVVTTPAVAAQKVAVRVADMARRSYLKVLGVIENMSSFTCDHGETYPLFGVGGGQTLATDIGAPLLGSIPLEPAVSLANDAGTPLSVASPGSAAGAVFAAIADRIADELLPPVDMAGCTARMLAAVEQALG
ncbi:MAG: ATP-binding protein involved in chromosome partitioning [Actinomycetota bacterium]|jgi:ATP-binding protein involved in chromosome partitioning|nr:ATP-binding protein involved in chromosome partitioning [Actinomycetota bacterium]MEA2971783.1 ATP-binding protein involved in chromosome partitioning [Actinomycetota bacterium]